MRKRQIVQNPELKEICSSISHKIRIAYARMADAERQCVAPAYNLYVGGQMDEVDKIVEALFSEFESRLWTYKRFGPRDVYVDPCPRFVISDAR